MAALAGHQTCEAKVRTKVVHRGNMGLLGHVRLDRPWVNGEDTRATLGFGRDILDHFERCHLRCGVRRVPRDIREVDACRGNIDDGRRAPIHVTTETKESLDDAQGAFDVGFEGHPVVVDIHSRSHPGCSNIPHC